MCTRGIASVVAAAVVLTAALPAEARRPRESAKRVTQIARLLDFTTDEVRDRLGDDEEFRVLAWHAVESRESRKKSGRALVGSGIATLVVGMLVGGILTAAGKDALDHPKEDYSGCFGLSCNQADAENTYNAGIGLMAGLGAAGTAMIIPGAVMLAKVSDDEQRLLDHVQAEDAMPEGARVPEARPTHAVVMVPPEPIPLDLEPPLE